MESTKTAPGKVACDEFLMVNSQSAALDNLCCQEVIHHSFAEQNLLLTDDCECVNGQFAALVNFCCR
ncbi:MULTISPECIES: hypothetical protein [Chryseobacterium]|uniref:Uncharacterized protein n=1 Tax=Chryseobacterium camelliae TaxID=1265445 RepID=A0ABU0TNU8_9FLAO|nr:MULTISPECIES: hypothetical protein [Chryseobacterium]MDT3407486.1 hypothetical protein [Pseudacidovorax intermedius]MDQ1098661.1 hypothetical protein [Chryseobacterium camelliae]MDQ1102586.1 hypothetical protein [Chryseobacterium sp. SORGH_AS_1048]MDR6086019.1 hypothetical protein [Chryseobacterium sp. SORGH_AS_0909]MDR6130386.1 hypothetical protein [Chryseobacterium sp. SORGH_AS_1175]